MQTPVEFIMKEVRNQTILNNVLSSGRAGYYVPNKELSLVKSAGVKLGIAGLGLTTTQVLYNRQLTLGNVLDYGFGAASFTGAGAIASGAYTITNLGVEAATGTSIGGNVILFKW